jgi:hypothetical protein
LDSAPNLGLLISRWELDKCKNCGNKSFRTSKNRDTFVSAILELVNFTNEISLLETGRGRVFQVKYIYKMVGFTSLPESKPGSGEREDIINNCMFSGICKAITFAPRWVSLREMVGIRDAHTLKPYGYVEIQSPLRIYKSPVVLTFCIQTDDDIFVLIGAPTTYYNQRSMPSCRTFPQSKGSSWLKVARLALYVYILTSAAAHEKMNDHDSWA